MLVHEHNTQLSRIDIKEYLYLQALIKRIRPGYRRTTGIIPVACLLSLVIVMIPSLSSGQSYTINDGSVTDCRGTLYDSGGADNTYQPNEAQLLTLCPDGSSGTHLRLLFLEIDLAAGDTLFFYDGRSPDPDSLIADHTRFYDSGSFFIQATVANPSGCLTLAFTSDATEQGSGWEASISCGTACQNIFAELTFSDPPVMPADTGFIDTCPEQQISLSARGSYPQTGLSYEHSDLTSSFVWDMGDGEIKTGADIQHTYSEPGGYIVQLTITDQFGCRNLNQINQRVRIAPPPRFDMRTPEPVCMGDTLSLTAALEPSSNPTVLIGPGTGGFPVNGARSDSLALPDGLGGSYSAPILIGEFAEGQVLTQADELESICINIEHSYLFDLDVFLTCPNGQSVTLQATSLRSGDVTLLGEPYEADDLQDTGTDGHLPGVGYDYCFTADGEYSWNNYVDTFGPGLLPAGNYASVGALEQLVGCPLNGEWTIEVADRLPNDNGWIFAWSINFARQLLPVMDNYSPAITTYAWDQNPEIDIYTPEAITSYTDKAGEINYGLTATDAFGCSWDTTIVATVLPSVHPDCHQCDDLIAPQEDLLLCERNPYPLDARIGSESDTRVDYTATPNAPVGFTDYPPASPLSSSVTVDHISPGILNDPAQQLLEVCVDLTTDAVGDIELYLRSPSGELLELSTHNGGGGQAYAQTCFTPLATDPIESASPPFSGSYSPEGSFNDLIGSTINGEWSLLVADAGDPEGQGRLISWSISFVHRNEITYSWSPATGLSCTDCPDPLASPDSTVTYIISAVDSFGCTDQDTLTIAYVDDLPQPIVTCENTANGQITFTWEPIPEITQYEIRPSRNGVIGEWQGPVNDLQFVIDGLSLQDSAGLEVRVFQDQTAIPCPIPVGSASCTYTECRHEAQIEEVMPVSCADISDGSAMLMGVRGVAPYRYFLDGEPIGQEDGMFSGLDAGDHFVAVVDAGGCVDTAFFEVPAPPPLLASIEREKAVSCPDGNDGILRAMVSGGVGGYRYEWVNATIGDTSFATGLSPGMYELLVSDSNGCESRAEFELANPTGMQLSVTALPTRCFDTQDGGATVSVSGGVPDYTYQWDTGATVAEPDDLPAGEHCLTVTDARGCSQIACITVAAPLPLSLDSINVKPADCYNTRTGSAEVFVSGGTADYTYLWSDELQQISRQAVRLPAGSYQVTVTDQAGCSLQANVSITQPDSLLNTITVTDTRCFDSSDGEALAVPVGGTAPYTYAWSSGGQSANETALAPGEYTVTITDANACQSEGTATVGRPGSPVIVEAVQTRRGCFGAQDNGAEAMARGGTGNTYTYQWDDSNAQQQAVALGLDAATYVVTATDQNGCKGVDTLIVNDLPPVMIGIIANAPSCSNTSDGRMGVNQVSGGIGGDDPDNFIFRWSNGATGLTIDGLSGDQEYAVTATDAQGCSGVQTRFIPQPDTIAVDLEISHVSCHGGNDGQATIANIQGPGANYTIRWDARTGADGASTVTGLTAGNYSLTITDEDGCRSLNTIWIDEPDPIRISFDVQDNDCFGDRQGSISAQVSGGTPEYVYSWDRGLPPGPLAVNLAAGDYTLTVSDDNGCSEIATVEIREPSDVSVDITTIAVSCYGARDGRIEIQTAGGTPPFLYSRDNIDYNGVATLVGLPAGPQTIYVRDGGGCQYVSTVEVGSPPEFRLDLGEDFAIELGDTVNLYVDIIDAAGEVDLFWSAPYDGTLSCEQCDGPAIWPQYQTTYTVTGYDANGCEAMDQVTVTVNKPRAVMVPTGFTPNGDGRNDRLLVHGREGTRIRVFRVFDRWGEMLYERSDFPVNDPDWGWDGTFRGQAAPGGVYLWYLEAVYPFDAEEKVLRGQTTLIR